MTFCVAILRKELLSFDILASIYDMAFTLIHTSVVKKIYPLHAVFVTLKSDDRTFAEQTRKYITYGWRKKGNTYTVQREVPSLLHYCDVLVDVMASQITSLTIVYSIVRSDADQRKHQSSASLACVRGIHRWPVNSPHKGPVTRKLFPFDDVIMAKHDIQYSRSVHRIMTWKHSALLTRCHRFHRFFVISLDKLLNKQGFIENENA